MTKALIDDAAADGAMASEVFCRNHKLLYTANLHGMNGFLITFHS